MLAFLGTALGRTLAAVLVGLLLLAGAYVEGRRVGAANVKTAVALAVAAERAHQAAAVAAAVETASQRAEAAEAAAEALQQQVDDLSEDVRRRPPEQSCPIGADDAKKLNAIR
ncbi:MAG: hypothetical protein J0H94_03830 [Rhizobiales bacterium]|nr:hypothetical protein [Hyphomicrobiales bacterium]